jgi:trehalose utilization protein
MSRQVIRATIWNENVPHPTVPDEAVAYPDGIHGALAEGLTELCGDGIAVRTATLADDEHGLPVSVLADTDVLLWWSHLHHQAVAEDVVDRVVRRVHDGMGFIALHSSQGSEVFRRLMGTSCAVGGWREPDRESLWVVDPAHPIAQGITGPVLIPQQEMYSEFFDIPPPDELVFISSFSGGEVFRSGCCFVRGRGRIFYFSPGHEFYPVYRQPEIRRIIANAVVWAAGRSGETT